MKPSRRGHHLVSRTLRYDHAGKKRIGGLGSADATEDIVLGALLIQLGERKAVRDIFDRVTVEVDLEFVHAFGVVAGHWNRPEDGMANIDDEHGSRLPAEYVQVRDIEPDILASNG
jgi:hypothetical protein